MLRIIIVSLFLFVLMFSTQAQILVDVDTVKLPDVQEPLVLINRNDKLSLLVTDRRFNKPKPTPNGPFNNFGISVFDVDLKSVPVFNKVLLYTNGLKALINPYAGDVYVNYEQSDNLPKVRFLDNNFDTSSHQTILGASIDVLSFYKVGNTVTIGGSLFGTNWGFAIATVRDGTLQTFKHYSTNPASFACYTGPYGPNATMTSGQQGSHIYSIVVDTNGQELSSTYWYSHPSNRIWEEAWVEPTMDPNLFVVAGNVTGPNRSGQFYYLGVHDQTGAQVWGSIKSGYCTKPYVGLDSTISVGVWAMRTSATMRTTRLMDGVDKANIILNNPSNSTIQVRGITYARGDTAILYGNGAGYGVPYPTMSDAILFTMKGMAPPYDPRTIRNQITARSGKLGAQRITLAPNPATSEVAIMGLSEELTPYTLINNLGQVVRRGKASASDNKIPLQGLPHGLYTVATERERLRLVVE